MAIDEVKSYRLQKLLLIELELARGKAKVEELQKKREELLETMAKETGNE